MGRVKVSQLWIPSCGDVLIHTHKTNKTCNIRNISESWENPLFHDNNAAWMKQREVTEKNKMIIIGWEVRTTRCQCDVCFVHNSLSDLRCGQTDAVNTVWPRCGLILVMEMSWWSCVIWCDNIWNPNKASSCWGAPHRICLKVRGLACGVAQFLNDRMQNKQTQIPGRYGTAGIYRQRSRLPSETLINVLLFSFLRKCCVWKKCFTSPHLILE